MSTATVALQVRRGAEAGLPSLGIGELGWTTDTFKLFCGSSGGNKQVGGAGTGTVTSVGLALPAELTVTVSPVTTSGTLTATWANESANLVFAGPGSGGAATPAFRALASADLPAGSVIVAKANLAYTAYTGFAGTTGDVEIVLLPAKAAILGVVIKSTIRWAGVPSLSMGVGDLVNGVHTSFSLLANSYTTCLSAAVSGTNFKAGAPLLFLRDFGFSTSVRLELTSGGGNLSSLTAGAIDCWVAYLVLP